jgi:hypothetical protein
MAALREEESRAMTPPRVDEAVIRAFTTSGHLKTPPTRIWAWPLAAAAAIVLAVGLGRLGQTLRDVSVANRASAPRLVLVGAPILQDEPVRVVRMRMPAAVLMNMGMRSTAAPGESIDVDVIVGEDGVARAVRF